MKKLLLTIFGAVLLSVGLMAQTITPIPPGGTWSTARGIINANDEIASDSMAILQLLKAPLASPTFTGTVSLPATWRINAVTVTSNAAELNILDGALCSFTELNYLVGVSSAIQTQLNNRLLKSDTAAMLSPYALTSEIGAGTGDVQRSDSLIVFVTPTQLSDSLLGAGVGVDIGDVRDEIADSLNVLRPLVVHVADTASMLTNYINKADTASMLTPYINRADTASMLTHYALTSEVNAELNDTTDIETLLQIDFDTDTIADLSELRLKISIADSTAGPGHYASNYDLTSGLALKANTTAVHLHADTIPLFVFGGGGGNAGDTTTFTTSTIYGSFYNAGSDSLRITELRVIMLGDATDSLSVDILWDVNLNDGTPTELNSTPVGINSLTTGDTDTTFDVAKIPPGVWVWCETPYATVGRRPTYFNAQISGYKIPKY